MTDIKIDVDNEKVLRALEQAPRELRRNWSQAGRETATMLLGTEGLRNYPPQGQTAEYKRGVGSYYIRADGSRKQYYNSERYGSHWNVRTTSDYKTVIGNSASYAPYLTGTERKTGPIGQARAMAKRGWKQIWNVAQGRLWDIKIIYEKWIRRALRRAGLQ